MSAVVRGATLMVVGSGGREHALAWKLLQSPDVKQVLVAPGNGGTAGEPGMENIEIAVNDFESLAQLAADRDVALTVIGPEAPLATGIVDHFKARKLRCFGPDKKAAQLEASKIFTKDFLNRHGIATAASASFSEPEAAANHIRKQSMPLVVKADGLAAGKGVVIAQTEEEALQGADKMLSADWQQNGQPPRILIEEYLVGEEASFIVIADGHRYATFATSQDHKRAFDNDQGPNTGGMGAYSPAPVVTDEVHRKVLEKIITPTLNGMAAEGMPYQGFLYAGLMITDKGEPLVLEFNCRFGDPEAQPVLLRLQSDLYRLCWQAAEGDLQQSSVEFDERVALGVVMASAGYPGQYQKGQPIQGLHQIKHNADIKVFHAGTRQTEEALLTAGGRVLCVTALGKNIEAARAKAYDSCSQIQWSDAFYRNDIGARAIARSS